jgi:hypothetical protein
MHHHQRCMRGNGTGSPVLVVYDSRQLGGSPYNSDLPATLADAFSLEVGDDEIWKRIPKGKS